MIKLLGGPTKVANLVGVSVPAVSMWQNGVIPYDKLVILAATLEKESHGLWSRKSLFPLSYKMIWPELDWCILCGQIDPCLVQKLHTKTLLGSFERLIKIVEFFIKRINLELPQGVFLFLPYSKRY